MHYRSTRLGGQWASNPPTPRLPCINAADGSSALQHKPPRQTTRRTFLSRIEQLNNIPIRLEGTEPRRSSSSPDGQWKAKMLRLRSPTPIYTRERTAALHYRGSAGSRRERVFIQGKIGGRGEGFCSLNWTRTFSFSSLEIVWGFFYSPKRHLVSKSINTWNACINVCVISLAITVTENVNRWPFPWKKKPKTNWKRAEKKQTIFIHKGEQTSFCS